MVLEKLKNLKFFRGQHTLFFILTGWSDVSLHVGMLSFPLISLFWSGELFSLHRSMKGFGPLLNTRVWPVKSYVKFGFSGSAARSTAKTCQNE